MIRRIIVVSHIIDLTGTNGAKLVNKVEAVRAAIQ